MAGRQIGNRLMLGLLLAGCAKGPPTAAAPAPAPDTVTVTKVDTVFQQAPADTEQERLARRLQVQLLEREAENAELRQKLDDAMREVVRTMARLQTVATRAEAASAMAEAELAYQALRNRSGAGPKTAEVKRLLDQSAEEFSRSNFAGAIYLANQGKNVARGAGAQAAGSGGAPLAGESQFAVPLTLSVTSRVNVREGPGTRFGVVRTLDPGAVVRGVSHVGDWVRITDADGRTGWVLGSLLQSGGAGSR